MPKKTKDYPEQINILAERGTTAKLKAISYYQGTLGHYAHPARDLIKGGIDRWIKSLSVTERKKFDSILETVITTEGVRRRCLPD